MELSQALELARKEKKIIRRKCWHSTKGSVDLKILNLKKSYFSFEDTQATDWVVLPKINYKKQKPVVPMWDFIQKIQTRLIRRALNHCAGNRDQAASYLGLKRTTLVEMIKKLGI
jgi:DNA-binding NtrC family response regulator